MAGVRPRGEVRRAGGEARESTGRHGPPGHASTRERLTAAAEAAGTVTTAMPAATPAPAGVCEPGAHRERQSKQYRRRPFHVSLPKENPDEKV
jgi:hypothetical protein